MAAIFFIDTLDMVRAANELPRLLMLLVVALAVGMVIESYKKSKKEALEEAGSNPGPTGKPAFDKAGFIRLLLFVALITAYVFLLQPIGYFIVTPIFVVASFLLLKATKLLYAIITGLGFSVFIYFLFVVFLHLPVPMGILSGIFG
jgi:hypothetical protein